MKPGGAQQILRAREEQIELEGSRHDLEDEMGGRGGLGLAAISYIAKAIGVKVFARHDGTNGTQIFSDPWPWARAIDARRKGATSVRLLVLAGTMIAAEIDRINRREARILEAASDEAAFRRRAGIEP